MKVKELIKLLKGVDGDYDVELSIDGMDKKNNIWVSFKDISVGDGYLERVCYIGGELDDMGYKD